MVDFITRAQARERFVGKRVAVVGSGPGVLDNAPGFVDGHEVVVRCNNYRLSPAAGFRNDVQYSFWGSSCRKTREELIADGVTLCMCKLPDVDMTQKTPENPRPLSDQWHRPRGQTIGLDYRPHYRRRRDAGFWFCPTYVPSVWFFMRSFEMLGNHMPTTGFAAIIDVLSFNPRSVFLTGYDFFSSGKHNVTDRWVAKNPDDPYRHRPDLERAWVAENIGWYPVTVDAACARALNMARAA